MLENLKNIIPLSEILEEATFPLPLKQWLENNLPAFNGFECIYKGLNLTDSGFQYILVIDNTSISTSTLAQESGYGFSLSQPLVITLKSDNGNVVIDGRSEIGITLPSEILRSVDGSYSPNQITSPFWFRLFWKEDSVTPEIIYGFPSGFSIAPSYIGETGLVFSAENANIAIRKSLPVISVQKATLRIPDSFPGPIGMEVILENAVISKEGFTGKASLEFDIEYDSSSQKIFYISTDPETSAVTKSEAKLFDYYGGLEKVSIDIQDNQLLAFDFSCKFLIPLFNKEVNLKLYLNSDSSFVASFSSDEPDGIPLELTELLKVNVKLLEINSLDRSLTISGGIEPLLYAKEGIKWPRMDVKNLRIDSSGKISIDEAWLDLKDLVNLDLFGFHFELRKIGLGTTQDHKMWVDISGGVKLVEQLPLGLDVEGFRIAWPDDLNFTNPQDLQDNLSKIEVQFQGVEINFAIPGTIKIDGLIRFFKEAQKVGFAGDMKLAVIPAGFSAEAGLMVGMNFEEPAYPFMYVYFGFESAAGIPLAQTGLALKGAIGLIGMNVKPNKTPSQHWYYDWYKGNPAPGVQQTTKWTDERNAFAIGIGVTISTADGVVKKTSGLLVLAIPGPILVINGKAFLLDTGLGSGEPPFEALAVFDSNEGTVLFNVQAQAEIVKDTIDAHAGVEAFFDFTDLTNWHLYLGQDVPEDRRIQANIMDIMTADAYLMLDMVDADTPHARAGVSVHFNPDIPDLEIPGTDCRVEIDAHLNIEGEGEVSINPAQFQGSVNIDGALTVNALGFEFGPSIKAGINFDGPTPFKLEGNLEFTLDMWPDDFHGEAEFTLKLPAPLPPITIDDPIQTFSLFSRFTSESISIEPTANNDNEETTAKQSPTVALDVSPVIAFDHEMNDLDDMFFLMHPNGIKQFKIGDITLTPILTEIRILEKKKSNEWNTLWEEIYYARLNGPTSDDLQARNPQKLIGAWLTESDPQSPGQPASRKLQLFTDNPLINTAHTYQMEPGLFGAAIIPKDHLSRLLIDDYPGLMFGQPKTEQKKCVHFCLIDSSKIKIDPGKSLNVSGLTFESNAALTISDNKPDKCCLNVERNLVIIFPEDIAECSITYCKKPQWKNDRKNNVKPQISYYTNNGKRPTFSADLNSLGDAGSLWYEFPMKGKTFKRIEIDALDFSIKQICYKTKKGVDNANANQQIVADNSNFVNPMNGATAMPYFTPGSYYKVTIETRIKADNPEGLYYNVLKSESETESPYYSEDGKEFHSVYYFQTDAPPSNLTPYVKWTYPNQELNRIFCDDKLAICFKRDYLHDFFDDNFQIEAHILDAQNNNLAPSSVSWRISDVYTLFPDEFTWEDHKREFDIPLTTRKEDILIITGPYSTPGSDSKQSLSRNQKYNLILKCKDAELLRIPFYTSGFGSRSEMNVPDSNIKIVSSEHDFNQISNDFTSKYNSFAESALAFYKANIDLDYGTAQYSTSLPDLKLFGREAVEKFRSLHREQKGSLDEIFNNACLTILGGEFFDEVKKGFKVVGIKNSNSIVAIFIKSPEKLFPKIEETVDPFARMTIKAGLPSESSSQPNVPAAVTIIDTNLVFNSDGDQFLLILSSPLELTEDKIEIWINFSFVTDPDKVAPSFFESTPIKHQRYTRPVIENDSANNSNFSISISV